MLRRDVLVHPFYPTWRLRLHPTSRLFTRVCAVHGPECSDFSSLVLHHVNDSWNPNDRDAHPIWTHNFVDLCSQRDNSPHQCDDLCHLFQLQRSQSVPTAVPHPVLFDEIAYFHGSNHWDMHWESVPAFSLHPSLAHMLDSKQTHLVATHLRQIKRYYSAMEGAGFFAQTACFMKTIFLSPDADRPRCPTSAFGAGFSGFDRIDERGWDRAGYESTAEHSQEAWNLRTSYQIAYFVALGRIFQIPAGHLVAYDPCYSLVDIVLLGTLGVRAFRKGDPGLKALRTFSNATLFYAPGAEQCVFTDAIARAAPIENLIILGGDASWCESSTAVFTTHYRCVRVPEYITANNGEAPCGEENCLQWIPSSRTVPFDTARGPAREPPVRNMVMPDGSLQPDD
ncbi:hypothetical protein DFH07DRAFT_862426 [Mycena maculata]|uniref:SRR1-like domain-containing protein n=1 Tax=Mycena maculata TaxID=230809 RepID=A0AAD7MG93_9AGAR|nr:hypothetical protein DFH07DRAFT_862426 [Mycena maculata]